MARFKGFGPKALAFFKALKFHQIKAWFEENRALYESDVLEPMIALLDDLTATFAKKKIPLKADGKRSIFRIHRDVRFAKDKSPYKTHCGAVMTRSGGKMENGLLYIHIDPEGCFAAAGFHMPEAAGSREAAQGDRQATPAVQRGRGGAEEGRARARHREPAHPHPARLRGVQGRPARPGAPAEVVHRRGGVADEARSPRREIAETIVDFAKRAEPLLRFGWAALD